MNDEPTKIICKSCNNEHTWMLPPLCPSCCLDIIAKEDKKSATWMKTFKRFSWASLLMLPPIFYIQWNYSLSTFIVIMSAFFYGQLFDSLIDFLYKKF